MTSKPNTCDYCKGDLGRPRHNKRFCSTRCQQNHYLQKRREARRDTSKPFICKECGKTITRGANKGRFPQYCGTRCRQDRDIRLRREAKEANPATCPNCEKTFVQSKTDQQYCCQTCQERAAYKREGRTPVEPPEQRLVKGIKENPETGCWEWQGATLPSGYGSISINNTGFVTHRYAWELAVGPIPDGYQVDHLCRNRRCCNPSHLEAVTQQENLRRNRLSSDEHFALRHGKGDPGSHLVTLTVRDLAALLTGMRPDQ